MKIADNLNEHGLKLFKGANFLFGVLWGIFGAFLILQNNLLANLWIAALFGWILRAKIDHLNHGIATSIILLAFLFSLKDFQFIPSLFITFFAGMVIIGVVHDYLTYSKKTSKLFSEYVHSLLYFTALSLIYSIITNEWVIFTSFFAFIISYEATRFLEKK